MPGWFQICRITKKNSTSQLVQINSIHKQTTKAEQTKSTHQTS
uniref:Uncharacterized protein n=1 Tax=Arundo donax TaxID=35708 RepID=A0A0A9C2X4_ARUDO